MRRGFVRRSAGPEPEGAPPAEQAARAPRPAAAPAAPPRIQSPEYAPLMQSVEHLTKRDPTTKLRALAALSSFIRGLGPGDAGAAESEALAYIAHVYIHGGVYRQLAIDDSGRIRGGVRQLP